jgi:hypothetical protein
VLADVLLSSEPLQQQHFVAVESMVGGQVQEFLVLGMLGSAMEFQMAVLLALVVALLY